MNSRFLPIGVAFAPSLPGGPLARAAQGQAVVDVSLVVARGRRRRLRPRAAVRLQRDPVLDVGGRDRRSACSPGSAARRSRSGSGSTRSTRRSSSRCCSASCAAARAKGVAALGALIALALVPFAPPGVPVLAASLPRSWPRRWWRPVSTATALGADRRLRALITRDQGGRPGRARRPPRCRAWFAGVVALLAPALFAALVVTQVLADGDDLGVGADTAGVAVAGVAMWRGVLDGRRSSSSPTVTAALRGRVCAAENARRPCASSAGRRRLGDEGVDGGAARAGRGQVAGALGVVRAAGRRAPCGTPRRGRRRRGAHRARGRAGAPRTGRAPRA